VSKKPVKFFLTLLLFFAVAFSSVIKACPDQSAQLVTNESFAFREQKAPNQDLERVHQPAVTGGQVAVQKNLVSSDQLSVLASHQPGVATQNLVIRFSSLLIKDYLLHIHPSHHFW
jgi:hypothetical protein